MMNNVKKYGLMTIATVLLVAMAFAGVASADKWTDADNFNATWYDAEGGDAATIYLSMMPQVLLHYRKKLV